MNKTQWHNLPIDSCLKQLKTSLQGLSSIEANQRLNLYGQNTIPLSRGKSIWQKWAYQFNNMLIYILCIAAVITSLLQHWIDAGVIIGVVILNAVIGYIQEGKAEKAIEALKKMLSLQATVIRDGKRSRITANQLVPGDIVLLRAGDKVPADLRLLKANTLQIDEAILTGESLPAEKNDHPVPTKTPLMDRTSLAYSGTFVTYGMGVGIVIATGKETEVGRISSMLKGLPQLSTPLLRQIMIFGRWIGVIILLLAFIIFFFGVFIRHYPLEDMFMAAVAIAVAAIPEGLPAIITITLAIGVTRMAERNAIVRRLASVETLSSVTVICTDKTGTLTKNELTIQQVITAKTHFQVAGSGYNNEGAFLQNGEMIDMDQNPNLLMLLRSGILCNEAELKRENDTWHLMGNPMDGALLSLGLKANLNHDHEIKNYPKTDAIPFNSQYKFMASLHHDHKGNAFIFAKGAPEKIVSMCHVQLDNQRLKPIDKHYWLTQINQLAENGMRVLALAYKKTQPEHVNLSLNDIQSGFTILGIVGIIDPPREEARQAVLKCQQAGMHVKMITGDHSLTAKAIAKQIGIASNRYLSGENMDVMSDAQLSAMIHDINIFSRTTPEHKLRLVHALKTCDAVVAMTGDGVNDAPALKNANIGIAMGIKGTEVAKEASEIVLADDNFASIEHAVEEARNVYNNLKKAILFILPTNGGEGLSILFAVLLGYTLPITPLQILWVNMTTAITLGLALAFEPAEKKLMQQKPRNPKEPLLSKLLLWRISFVSLLFVFCMFGLFIYNTTHGLSIPLARTMIVNLLVLLEVVYLINCRRIYDRLSLKDLFSGGKPAWIAIGIVMLLQLGFTYLPFMQFIFHVQPLSISQWGIIILIAIVIFFSIEFEKTILRKLQHKKHLNT